MDSTRTDYKVGDFLEWQRGKQLELSPSFQRRSVWRKGAKSFLIDTVLRKYPTPPIFLRDLPSDLRSLKTRREVVDGQQRLRTVISFIDGKSLEDFDERMDSFSILKAHDTEFAGFGFHDLPKSERQRILDYKFSVTVFSADTDDREILDVFARMNATGVSLNAQELRNANYYGEFKSSAYACASRHLEFWIDNNIYNPNQIARMKEVELASDLIALIMNGVTQKSKSTLDKFYKDYDDEMPKRAIVERRFDAVMDTINQYGELPDAFTKTTLFYALFAAVYSKMYGLNSPLNRSGKKAISSAVYKKMLLKGLYIATGKAPTNVQKSATTRTTHASSRNTLVKYLTA